MPHIRNLISLSSLKSQVPSVKASEMGRPYTTSYKRRRREEEREGRRERG